MLNFLCLNDGTPHAPRSADLIYQYFGYDSEWSPLTHNPQQASIEENLKNSE